MFDFLVLKFFYINTHSGKAIHHLLIDGNFLPLVRLKLILIVLLGVVLTLLLVVVFFVGVWGNSLVVSLLSLISIMLWLLISMPLKKLNR